MEVEGAPGPRGRRWNAAWIAALAAGAFLVGLAVANWPRFGEQATRLLAVMGQPRLDAIRAMEEPIVGPDGIARTDWLVFFEDTASPSERSSLLARYDSVRFIDETFFSNGVVVSIPEAAGEIVEALRSSPAVWLMLKDRPFFLCH